MPERIELDHQQLLRRLDARHSGPMPIGSFATLSSDDRVDDPEAGTARLFVAIRGARHDSHDSLEALARAGLIAGAVGERPRPAGLSVPYYRVSDTRRALSELAIAFAGDPGEQLRLYGITGTNGKSTTVRLLASILEAAERSVGWLSTVTQRVGATEVAASLTTPEPVELAQRLAQLVEAGGTDAVLEVSSHALEQGRVAPLVFSGAIFTNLSRDHLDYHGDAQAYLQAKLRLFEQVAPGGPAVIPLAGPVTQHDPQLQGLDVRTFGLSADADAYPEDVTLDAAGIRGTLRVCGESVPVATTLLGRHNLQNLLAAALLARRIGVNAEQITVGLSKAPTVRGRLERVSGAAGDVFVDYAHTPDALEAVLGAMRDVAEGRLIVLFGCGGDRDRGKRPQMGEVAARLADVSFVTSDNPRSEDPQKIIDDILQGMSDRTSVRVDVDRHAAIRAALSEVRVGDVLIVAGKGHETEQLIGSERLPFDDRQVIESCLQAQGDDASGGIAVANSRSQTEEAAR